MLRQVLNRSPGRAWVAPRVAGAVSSGEQVTVHQVKLQSRRGLMRKAATYGMVAGVCLYVWDEIAFLPLKNLDTRPLPKGLEEEVEPLFMPFPFTEKQVQPAPYAGAGEEWQSFIEFNKDDKLRQRVKDDLSTMVRKAAEKNNLLKKWTKTGEGFKLGPTWLIMTFPEKPPPEFIRWGAYSMEWSEEGLVVKTQTMDARTKALLDRVLMPYPVASASYAFAKAMVKQNVSKVAKYFGYQSGGNDINTSGPHPDIAKTLTKLGARQTADGSTAASSSSAASSATSASSSESETSQSSNPTAVGKSESSKEAGRSLTKENIPYYSELVGKGSGPWMAFIATYKQAWKPLRYYPPRGSVAVHGMVALDSPKGRVFIDVFAWYHPKTDSFHQDSVTMNLRSISPYNQRPRR
ncbi:hypothetical protein M406DRAFT_330657 [Cryphonectria parasitica EP155]|uniref:Uncharacterized protein n=1 Tax=Cryphonectria parasitica (strain ATCC 38755 / EP155) TaxID=660469 RepID=A0A9P5CMN8_CRYP1|nr:uncharacterized protein M406DRAFT_330657 [Cryphonectria parasitica EP155]KAF3764313.1 hypothetical protein M406DRAFT_330657 [Cryphonectria parasitica EP155]